MDWSLVGKRIREARIAAGMTQEDLAAKGGVKFDENLDQQSFDQKRLEERRRQMALLSQQYDAEKLLG